MVRVIINGRTFSFTIEEFFRTLQPGNDVQVLEIL